MQHYRNLFLGIEGITETKHAKIVFGKAIKNCLKMSNHSQLPEKYKNISNCFTFNILWVIFNSVLFARYDMPHVSRSIAHSSRMQRRIGVFKSKWKNRHRLE